MQRKGLLQRRRTKEDARAYAVKLTDEGRRVLRTAEPTARRVDDRILEALPNKQREQFIDELQAIVDTLQKLSPTPERGPRATLEKGPPACAWRAFLAVGSFWAVDQAAFFSSLRLIISSAICT